MTNRKTKAKPAPEPHPRDGIGARIEAMLKERDDLNDRLSYHRSAAVDLRAQISKINSDLREAIGANVEEEPLVAGLRHPMAAAILPTNFQSARVGRQS